MANPLTALYRVISKGLAGAKAPLASDINQFVDLFNGNLDAGQLTLAAQISAPSTTGVTAAAATGTALGIGAYLYKLTYVTGNLQADNTYTVIGETTGSSSLSVTTTSGNQNVTISGLPTVASWPSTAIGIRIYRTAVGGADGTQKLVGSIFTNYARTSSQTSFTDSTADASLGAAILTTNTTGTTIPGSAIKGTVANATNASSVPFSGITSKPTTISGYGITDNIVASITAGANISVTNPSSGLGAATVGLTGVIPVANGGTGSSTQNWVDLTTGQTIAGTKTFSGTIFANSNINLGGTFFQTTGAGVAGQNGSTQIAPTTTPVAGVTGNQFGIANAGASWLLGLDTTGNLGVAGAINAGSAINSIAGAGGGTLYWTMAMRGSLKILTIYLNAFNTNGTQQSFNLPTGFQYGAILSSSIGDTSVNYEYSTNSGSTWTGSNLPSVPQNMAINAALNAFGINIAAASGAKTGTLIIEGI